MPKSNDYSQWLQNIHVAYCSTTLRGRRAGQNKRRCIEIAFACVRQKPKVRTRGTRCLVRIPCHLVQPDDEYSLDPLAVLPAPLEFHNSLVPAAMHYRMLDCSLPEGTCTLGWFLRQ